MSLIKRNINLPKRSFFLLGPRGTGKSTLIKQDLSNALQIDLLNPEALRSYLARPERLFEIIHANPGKKIVVIDEIQEAANILPVIHSLMEEKKDLQFVLTGSSARKLKRTNANLLGGRALVKYMNPFMASELGKHFSLKNALTDGMLPLLYNQEHPQQILQSYITLYLQEEIHAEGLVRNIENFSRFLEVISFSQASLLNTANIARDSSVKRKTVENYLDLLEDLLLSFRLDVFTRRAKRGLTSHPKFYLFDSGVYNALRPKGPMDKPEEIAGAALETLVAQHLKAWRDYSDEKTTISFWRTRSGVEVDFVIYGDKHFYAIEVKNTNKINPADTKPLETFMTDYPESKGILLYRGKERLKIKNVTCIPCEEFLLNLTPNNDKLLY